MKCRTLLLGLPFAAIAVIVATTVIGVYFVVTTDYGIDDAYALRDAADIVIDYMEEHDGEWPRSWGDLQRHFDTRHRDIGGWRHQHVQDSIVIDFDADPDQLRRQSLDSSRAEFRVIWPKRDWGVRLGDDPNQMLHDYFRAGPKGSGVFVFDGSR